tara:strand:- start:1127 stop:1519 length:393 start_codon:yes stop_codon:yes gene_type:complete
MKGNGVKRQVPEAISSSLTVLPHGVSGDCDMATVLRALGHPARLEIIRALASRGRCFCGEIVEMLPLVQSTVSQHLKVLKDAGLIEGAIDGPRSCYRLNTQKLKDASALMADLTVAGEAASACHDGNNST